MLACAAATLAAPVAPWLPWRFIGGDSFGPSTNFPHPAGGGAPYGAISAYNTEDTSITPNTLHPISMRFGVSGTAANSRREAHKRAREARAERFKNGKGGGTLDPVRAAGARGRRAGADAAGAAARAAPGGVAAGGGAVARAVAPAVVVGEAARLGARAPLVALGEHGGPQRPRRPPPRAQEAGGIAAIVIGQDRFRLSLSLTHV